MVKLLEMPKARPEKWGARGDTYLWMELEDFFDIAVIPNTYNTEEIKAHVYDAIERASGVNLHTQEEDLTYVKELDPGHGMSAGMVSKTWWETVGVPLIVNHNLAAV